MRGEMRWCGLLIVCLTIWSIPAEGKLPELQRHLAPLDARMPPPPETRTAPSPVSETHRSRPRFTDVPEEYMPISFPKATDSMRPREEILSVNTHMQVAVEQGADEAPHTSLWRPNDLHFVTTRAEAFQLSQPHSRGGNCHIARIRAMSQCPNDCSGHGFCGVTQPQRGYKYIASTLPGVCHCSRGWTGDDCGTVAAIPLAVVIVRTGNAKSDSISEPGDVLRITVVSTEDVNDVQVGSLRIGGKNVTGFAVTPGGGSAPSKVWEIGYLVRESDFGPVQFIINYLDIDNRPGSIKQDNKVVKGSAVVSNYASGALFWRMRALTIGSGGYTTDFMWRVSEWKLFHEPNLVSPVNMARGILLSSSESSYQCGFLGDCENMTSGYNTYLFVMNQVGSDAAAFSSKLMDYPQHGYGKRIKDLETQKYIGTGNFTDCARACDGKLECSSFTYSPLGKRQGCFLHTRLTEEVADSIHTQTTYFKLAPETVGRDMCTAEQEKLWNCPLHGCNHGHCGSCGSQSIPYGRDLVQGTPNMALDPYWTHYWQASENVAGEWLMMAFTSPVQVGSVEVRHTDIRHAPMSAMLEMSNDFVNWMPVAVMEDFSAEHYTTDLPTAEEIAGAKRKGTQLIKKHQSYMEFEEQALIDLGLGAVGKKLIPTVMFCYYALPGANVTDFFDYSSYDEPEAQLAAKFYRPKEFNYSPLPTRSENPFVECTNFDAWLDFYGDGCDHYEENGWCTFEGDLGVGWNSDWGDLEDYAKDSVSARSACCACGGGNHAPHEIIQTEEEVTEGQEDGVEIVSLIQVPTTADMVRADLDDYGCRSAEGYTWCAYTMSCVQDYEGGQGGPCLPPKSPVRPPTLTASAFAFRDECPVSGVIGGKFTILAGYNDQNDEQISEYAIYWARNDRGGFEDVVSADPLVVVPKGKSVLIATIPDTQIPEFATHFLLISRNQGLEMGTGITRKIPDQLNTYGDLGSYTTGSCLVWRRNGPNFHEMQGMTFAPMKNYYRGKNMTMKIGGRFQCSDTADAGNIQLGRGSATVQWAMFQSPDGSNENAFLVPKIPGGTERASGTFHIKDGACVGYDEGVPIQAHVDRFQGGYIATWFRLTWHGVTSQSTCAELGAEWKVTGQSCGSSKVPTCSGQRTFHEASQICSAMGARLCTTEEADLRVATSTGCGYDATVVWTGTPCLTVDGVAGAYAEAGNPDRAVGQMARLCHPTTERADVRCCADVAEPEEDSNEDYALVCDDVQYEIAQGMAPGFTVPSESVDLKLANSPGVKRIERPEVDTSGEFYCPNDCPDGKNDPLLFLTYRPHSMFSGTCESDEGKACLNTWIGNGCPERPPFMYGLDCSKYKHCYKDAMENGLCGADFADEDCNSPGATQCIDTWVGDGCPDEVPVACAKYEECAVRAVMDGRCEVDTIDCESTDAVQCVDSWVTDTSCGDYPPFGNDACRKFDVCAKAAADAGRCGELLGDCGSVQARSCVDSYVTMLCPEDMSSVTGYAGLECDTFTHCMGYAEESGRCDQARAAAEEAKKAAEAAKAADSDSKTPLGAEAFKLEPGDLGAIGEGFAEATGAVGETVGTLTGGGTAAINTMGDGFVTAGTQVGDTLANGAEGVGNVATGGAQDVEGVLTSGAVGGAIGGAADAATGAMTDLKENLPVSNAVQMSKQVTSNGARRFVRHGPRGQERHHLRNSYRRDQFHHSVLKKSTSNIPTRIKGSMAAIQKEATREQQSTVADMTSATTNKQQATLIVPATPSKPEVDWRMKNAAQRQDWLRRAMAQKQRDTVIASRATPDHVAGPHQMPPPPALQPVKHEEQREHPEMPSEDPRKANEEASIPNEKSVVHKDWAKENDAHKQQWLDKAKRMQKQMQK